MPSRKKIDLEKVLASLSTLCTSCSYQIPPAEQVRVSFTHMRCPKCSVEFEPAKAKRASAA